MPDSNRHLRAYASEVTRLAASDTTNEQTYYPSIRALMAGLLADAGLPSDVRTNTSERRAAGGADFPDLGLYDGAGDFILVCGEVKLPTAALPQMAVSTERNDQIGRYLTQTNVAILCNVRSFGLLTVNPDYKGTGPVPPTERRLEQIVELWPSATAMMMGTELIESPLPALVELIETAITRFAPIAEPQTLARVLARQARRAKAGLPTAFGSSVQGLADDFGRALGITFEGEEGEEFFRSSLVQTVFYALFAGWLLHKQANRPEPFRWQELSETLRIPFLGSLFHDIQHPERIAELNLRPALDAASETLSRVNTETFFERLGMLRRFDDAEAAAATAILYFYEPFLEAFDPELRKRLGVWYTPPEIVRYQVRKVDRILRERLGCALGFADPNVVVLDPACGTGAYLIEVGQCIAETLRAEGVGDDLADRMIHALTHRVIGFEILTAPFVIAHLQLYLLLDGMGVTPAANERLAVFLTNALTGWTAGDEQMKLNFPELQHEHDAARAVKSSARIIVVLGNPPYNRFAGAALDEESDLVDHYKGIRRDAAGRQIGTSRLFTEWRIRKQLLDDLYIRFFRLAETRIAERAQHGVVSFISNSSFYTGRSHPLMRDSLLTSFAEIWVDNLNGDKYKTGKIIPDGLPDAGTTDQSVFSTPHDPRGIQVGAGITTLLRTRGDRESVATVHFRDLWGRADAKRRALLDSLEFRSWSVERKKAASGTAAGPRDYVSFTPTRANRWKLLPREDQPGYEDWPSLDLMFPVNYQGVNPNRGLAGSVVEMDRRIVEARMRDYYSAMSYPDFEARHPVLCTPRARYEPQILRPQLLNTSEYRDDRIVPYVVFPLDSRWLYYETEAKLLNERRPDLWDNLVGNDFYVTVPQPRRVSESRPVLATSLFDLHLHDRGSVGFPAEVITRAVPQTSLFGSEQQASDSANANLDPEMWQALRNRWSLSGELDGPDAKWLARRLFRFCLAICHSPQYEEDHSASLAEDWAHVPIPSERELFERTADAGEKIAVLLNPLANPGAVLQEMLGPDRAAMAVLRKTGGGPIRGNDYMVTVSHYGAAQGGWRATREGTGVLYINPQVHFENVPERVWAYELGGYPVLKKWLGYRDAGRRPGVPLSLEEVDHLRSIVHRIECLHRLYPELDSLYQEACANVLLPES